MIDNARPIRIRVPTPPAFFVGPGTCNLCTANGKTRTHKTETGRADHLTNYHGRCKGCRFEHPLHEGPCSECAHGHPVESEEA